ncbi:MAG: outer membrane beta-barrel protein, partial [Candidatus Saccharimonadales bacterium]
MEYKPDTVNYLKVTPTFSYAGTNTNESEVVNFSRSGSSVPTSAYNETTTGNSQAPNYGFIALYNHRFKHRHNFSINATFNSAPGTTYQNPIYNFTAGTPTAPANQMINTYSRTNSYGSRLSYLFPIGKLSYLEFNYNINYAVTSNNKETDTLDSSPGYLFQTDSALSNIYNYTFTTNKAGMNYRFIQKKYNYTLGLGVQDAVLNGNAPATGFRAHSSAFNLI